MTLKSIIQNAEELYNPCPYRANVPINIDNVRIHTKIVELMKAVEENAASFKLLFNVYGRSGKIGYLTFNIDK